MKRLVLILAVMSIAVSLFAQTGGLIPVPASGNWGFAGGRYYQNDANARLAKANLRVPQSDFMVYDFNVRLESGIEDGHGGIGIHLFVDEAFNAASWGAGRSYLLWLNYDEAPVSSDIDSGLSAQIYKSINNSTMELMESIPLNHVLPLITDRMLANPVSFRIEADGNTGEIRVYDPMDLSIYYPLYVDYSDLPLSGDWVAIRTNGLSVSFQEGL